jgi:protein SCO1/2
VNEPTDPGDDRSGEPRRTFLKNPYVWFFLVGAVTLTLMRPCLRREPPPPPVVGRLPAYELTDAGGRAFGSADLAGRVYVADFIFTRCTSICPLLTKAMGRLQDQFRERGVEGVHLVSFSVDPDYDTPERLREYAERHGADPDRWTFLTGDRERIRELLVDGFKLAMGDVPPDTDNLADIAHSGKFVIVDGEGGIRGYYDTDQEGLDEIFHRSQHVLRERRP